VSGQLAESERTRALDEWLTRPDVRIARCLKQLDWATASDLFSALDLKHAEYDEFERALSSLVTSGHVLKRSYDGGLFYQLRNELEPPRPNDGSKPTRPGVRDGEELGAWFWWRGSWRPR
jgi:hypothetical protein